VSKRLTTILPDSHPHFVATNNDIALAELMDELAGKTAD
jgi:hypothetical protein